MFVLAFEFAALVFAVEFTFVFEFVAAFELAVIALAFVFVFPLPVGGVIPSG